MSLKALRVILFLISFIYLVIKICWIADLLGILVKVKSRFYCLIAFSICKGCSATRTFSIMFCYKIFAHFHSLIGKIYLNWNIRIIMERSVWLHSEYLFSSWKYRILGLSLSRNDLGCSSIWRFRCWCWISPHWSKLVQIY